MKNKALLPQQLKIEIQINGPIPDDFDDAALNSLIKKHTQTLIDELGLPVKAQVKISYLENENAAILPTLLIEGEKCRIPLSLRLDRSNSMILAAQLMTIILDNRELLVSGRIAEIIREIHILNDNKASQQLDITGFQNLLKTMAQRGFSSNRLADFKSTEDKDGWDHLMYFDAIVASADSTRIKVSYSDAYQKINQEAKDGERLSDMSALLQDGLFYELGATYPIVDWEPNPEFEDDQIQVQLNDITYPIIRGIKPDKILVNDTTERLKLLNIEGQKAFNPANNLECSIVDDQFGDQCQGSGLTIWNALGYMILYLSAQLRRQAGIFITKDIVENHLENIKPAFPSLVSAFLERYNIFTLTWLLRDLLEDEISIRDMRNILDQLLLANGEVRNDLSDYIVFYPEGVNLIYINGIYQDKLHFSDLAEYVRVAFKRYISHKYSAGQSTLVVYLMDPALEKKIQGWKGKLMPDADREEIIKSIYFTVDNSRSGTQKPIILTTIETRRMLQDLIRIELPQIAVLSYQELSPDLNIQPIERINLD